MQLLDPILTVLFILLAILAVGGGVYYTVVFRRTRRARKALPTARTGLSLPPPDPAPSVCVIVPAHNEQRTIAAVAHALLAQDYPDLSIIFALDRCTDDTKSILERIIKESGDVGARCSILINDHCPNDWAGKTHVLWRAATESPEAIQAERLLFIDADTALDPRCISATVALQTERNLGLLSLMSTLTTTHPFERTVQPAAAFELVRQFPPDYVNDPTKRRSFANGQFMLFTQSAYQTLGTHERVKDALLEDLAFAKLLSRSRYHTPTSDPEHSRVVGGCLFADGMFTCSMYDSPESFRKGWKRIYQEAADRSPKRLRSSANRLLLSSVVMPAAALGCIIGAPIASLFLADNALATTLLFVGTLSLTAAALALAEVYRAQKLPALSIISYPVGGWITASILTEAARDLEHNKPTEWGGKAYTRPTPPTKT